MRRAFTCKRFTLYHRYGYYSLDPRFLFFILRMLENDALTPRVASDCQSTSELINVLA
jgi:hypothetical protein